MTYKFLSSNDACPNRWEKELSSYKMLCLMRRIMIEEGTRQGFYKPDRGIMWAIKNNGVLAIIKPLLLDLLRLWGGY